MNRVSWLAVAAGAVLFWAAVVRAETEAEYLHPGPASAAGARNGAAAPERRPRSSATRPFFAADSAAGARRLEPHEREERRFLKQAAAGSRFQAEGARLALVKSGDPAVRSLAITLIDRHVTSGNELLWMLHQRGLAAPMLEDSQRRTLVRLGRLQGARFDREFIEAVALRAPADEMAAYEKASTAVHDPVLKGWIARNQAALRRHLATAERLAAPARPAARSGGPPARLSRHPPSAP